MITNNAHILKALEAYKTILHPISKGNTMNYVTQYDYSIRTGGTMTFNADSKDEAEELAKEYIADTYPEAFDIEIVEVDAVK